MTMEADQIVGTHFILSSLFVAQMRKHPAFGNENVDTIKEILEVK